MKARTFAIGQRLLLGWFIGQVLLGYSAALAISTPLWAWHQDRVALALWADPAYPPETQAYRAWVMGLFGGTLASWGVLAAAIVAGPFARREPWAWWALLASVLAWGPLDTAISASHGVGVNVLFNLCGMAVMLGLLGLTWPAFRDPAPLT